MLENARSFGGKLVLEAYKHAGVQVEVKSGWAKVDQKQNLKGLKVLIQSMSPDGTPIPAGSTAYIKGYSLETQAWAKEILKSDTLAEEFILCNINDVEYFVPPAGDAA